MDGEPIPWWAELLMILLPLVFTVAGGIMLRIAHRFMQGAVRRRGTVVDVRVNHSTDNDGRRTVTYQPVFEYTDERGVTHRAPVWLSSSGRNFPIGTEKEILANPDYPDTVRLPGFWVYGFGAIFAIVGVVVGVVMVAVFLSG